MSGSAVDFIAYFRLGSDVLAGGMESSLGVHPVR